MEVVEDRVARVYVALHARFMRHVDASTSRKTRQVVETTLFVVLLHAVALLALLHMSFVRSSDAASCLVPFLPPAAGDAHLLRIQITAPPNCAIDAPPTCIGHPSTPLSSFVFASQRELLALRRAPDLVRIPRELPVIAVPRSSDCFDLRWLAQSSPLWDVLLDYVLGYDTIVVNHVMRWKGAGGVLLHEASGRVVDVGPRFGSSQSDHRSWLALVLSKVQTLYLCVSLFFTCTTLIDFLVHELFTRSLVFSDLVQRRDDMADPVHYTRALGVHCAHSLAIFPIVLGMVFFFLELYVQDYVLTFGVLAFVALCEGFSIICARTTLSRLYFPRLFFCWFAMFHIYLSAYPSGFSHLALLALAITLLHTIVFFVNCFELPSVVARIQQQSE